MNRFFFLFMNFLRPMRFIIIFTFIFNLHAQNNNYNYQYEVVKMDSTFDKNADVPIETYINHLKQEKDIKMDEIIGVSKSVLTSYSPASPLSNLLVDMLFEWGNQYLESKKMAQADMALLNFGGIRAPLPQGNVTVGDIFKIAPFDNTVTFVYIKGSELKKMFDTFSERKNTPMANVKITYYFNRIKSLTIGDNPLDPDKIYTIVTINFLALGGDGLINNMNIESVTYLEKQVRDVYIEEIKKKTAQGLEIESKMDRRIYIEPMP